MAAEKPDENGEAWLDALAGRPAGVDADAAALRDLLLPIPDAQAPDWQTLRAHAEAPATPLRRVAANEGRWWPRVGVAAAVLVLVGVVFNFRQHDERPQLRGGSGTPHAVAVWLVDDPDTAALTLATELRALAGRFGGWIHAGIQLLQGRDNPH